MQAANYKRRGCTRDAAAVLSYLPHGLPPSSELVDVLMGVFEAGIAK
jgi:hypothetical protein